MAADASKKALQKNKSAAIKAHLLDLAKQAKLKAAKA
jgi:hypothetical protein